MVDITRCERCGKVIPALAEGCPYCGEPERGLQETPYLPLALRLLLLLFVVNVAVTMVLAVMTLVTNTDPSLRSDLVLLMALVRFLLGGVTLVAFFFREPWARTVPFVFLAWEAFAGLAVLLGWIEAGKWAGGMVTPIWNVMFLFLFLREDVQTRFDPRVADRRELDDLLKTVERGEGRGGHDRRRY